MAKANIDIVGRDFTASAFDKVNKRVTGITSSVKVLGGAFVGLGAALSVGAFSNAIREAADFQDQLAKMSKSTGIAVESLAGLEFAATQSGTNIDQVAKGIRRFSRVILESKDGTDKYGKLIQALGLDMEKLKTQTPEEQFFALSEAINKNVSEQERAVVVTSLFGNEYAKLTPLLSLGREQLQGLVEEGQKLNPVTAESAARAELFNDNLDKLGRTAGAVGQIFFNTVSPALNQFTDDILESIEKGTLFQDTLNGFFRNFTTPGLILKFFEDDEAEEAAESLKKVTEETEDLGEAADETRKEYKSFQEILDQVNATLDNQKNTTRAVASAKREVTEATKQEKEEAQQLEQELRDIERITRSVETADQRLNREITELNRLLATGKLDWDVYTAAMRKAREEADDLGDEFQESFSELDQFALQAARNIQTAFGEAFFDVFDGRLDDVVDNFGRAAKRMAAEALAADLLGNLFGTSSGFNNTGALANAISTAGSRGTSGLSSLFGSASSLSGAAGAIPGAQSSVFANGFIGGPGTALGATGGASSFLSGAGSALNTLGAGALGSSFGIGIGTALAGDKRVFGANGSLTSSIGAGIGTGIGAFFGPLGAGVGGAIGGLLGGAVGGLFGRGPLKQQDSLIRGNVTEQGIGSDFLTATNFKAKGGAFRSDKVDRVIINANTGELVNGAPGLPESGISSELLPFASEASQQALQIGQIFDQAITGFNTSLRQSADILGIGSSQLDNFQRWIQLTADNAEGITESQIAQEIQNTGDHMANVLLPGLQNFVKTGETATSALTRIVGEFAALENALIVFGVNAQDANSAIKDLGIGVRSALVEAAGGTDAFNQQIAFFASNFLTAEEQLDIAFNALDAQMQQLGLSANISIEEFKALVISVTQAGGASTELTSELLKLAPAFFQVKQSQAELAAEAQTAAPAVDNLVDSVDDLGDVADNAAELIGASFQRIDDARTALTAAENQLATAQARSALNAAQLEQSEADQNLAIARSNLQQARNQEQQAQRTAIQEVISQRSALIAEYQSEAQTLKGIADRFRDFSSRIFEFRDGLALGNLSPFSPGEQLGLSEQKFEQTLARALAGDEEALNRLPAVSEAFLEASRRFNGATDTFAADFARVSDALAQTGASAQTQSDIARSQLEGVEETILELQDLNEQAQDIANGIGDISNGIISVEQATAELAAAQERAAQATEDVRIATGAVEDALFVQNGFIDDVGQAVLLVRDAVLELGGAILQGPGNPNISDQQIRDFVAQNPGLSARELEQVAVENGVSARQFARATNTPISAVNRATEGRSVQGSEIASFVDAKIAQGDFMGIYRAAIQNGITSQRLAAESSLSLEEINQFVRANNLQQFAQGTDFVQRSGLAVIHRGEAITPASVPNKIVDQIRGLSSAIQTMMTNQNRHIEALVGISMESAREAATRIIKSNKELAQSAPWQNRIMPRAS